MVLPITDSQSTFFFPSSNVGIFFLLDNLRANAAEIALRNLECHYEDEYSCDGFEFVEESVGVYVYIFSCVCFSNLLMVYFDVVWFMPALYESIFTR